MMRGIKSPLCAFADWFPNQVAAELEQARLLLHQSRETSWTDRMLLELRKLRDPRIVVQNSNERVTGADMDWHFVRYDGRRHLHLAVQAKILHYTAVRTPHRYGELAHPKRTGRQSRQLTNYARRQLKAGGNTFPMYLFYNPASVARWHRFCSPGVTLASAYRIKHHLDSARKSSTDNKVPLPALEFGAVAPLMFCLHRIFCGPVGPVPDPDEVAGALSAIEAGIAGRTKRGPRPPRPRAGEHLPEDIRHIVSRMRDGVAGTSLFDGDDFKRPDRPRVIFLGGKH